MLHFHQGVLSAFVEASLNMPGVMTIFCLMIRSTCDFAISDVRLVNRSRVCITYVYLQLACEIRGKSARTPPTFTLVTARCPRLTLSKTPTPFTNANYCLLLLACGLHSGN